LILMAMLTGLSLMMLRLLRLSAICKDVGQYRPLSGDDIRYLDSGEGGRYATVTSSFF
jgi:hypothetical protein